MGFFDFLKRKEAFPTASRPASRPPSMPVQGRPRPTVTVTFTSSISEPDEATMQDRINASIYLHSSRWDELLKLGADGMPPLSFQEHGGRLWFREDATGKLVKVANRKLAGMNIWTVKLRGSNYYGPAVEATTLRPFEPVALHREPDNEYDQNAVAVHSSAGKIGYFNKQMAARLAKRIDSGDEFVAFITSSETPINVIAAPSDVMTHLRR